MHPRVDLKIKLLDNNKYGLPKYATVGSSGFDLYACIPETKTITKCFKRVLIPTGISVEIPPGYELQIRPKSGLSLKGLTIVNSPATIDQDFVGEIQVILRYLNDNEFDIEPGMKIAQAVLCPVVQANFIQVESLTETERGAQGFGSSGLF